MPRPTRDDVTVIMTTFRNEDFTRASVWSLRRFYPDIPIIFADGDPDTFHPLNEVISNSKVVGVANECTDTLRNVASALVETPFVLFMDNDVKVQSAEALELLLEVMEFDNVAQTGAYAVTHKSYDPPEGIVSTVFDGYTEVNMFPCYFALHRTAAFRAAGGFPKRPPYAIPEHLWKDRELPSYAGDLTIGLDYQRANYVNMTPRKTVPVLHWGQANRWMEASDREFDDWWYANVKHTHVDPMPKKESIRE